MTTRVLAAGLLLAGGMMGLARADDKKTDPATRFAGFVHHSDMHGEVVSASDTSVTIRVPMPVRTGNGKRGGVKLGHKDYTFEYHPDGQARVMKLPQKTDADGKKVGYTK